MINRLRRFFRESLPQAITAWYQSNPGYGEIYLGLARRLLAFLLVVMFIFVGGVLFERVDVVGIVRQARQVDIFLRFFPAEIEQFFVFVFSWANLRYVFPAIGALVCVFIAGAYFVKDIYNLKHLKDALHYVVSSMFAWRYPRLNIDNGKKQIPPKHVNLLDAIGGPGYIMIQPGNVVLFRKLREPSRNALTTSFMMTRFETIGQIASLDDQHGTVEKIEVMTRDGIRVEVRDIHYRYRIESERVNNRPLARTQQRPYPFSHDAIDRMAYNLSVNDEGLITWAQYMRMQVTGVIEDYINSHSIDNLTAPREGRQDPRGEIRNALFSSDVNRRLSANGTQLIWVDIGHFDIVPENVDQERIGLWAAEWIGNAEVEKAFGEVKRLAWQEQGRAEGQAEMIVGISEALRSVQISGDRDQNVRALLLTRIAQVLDAMRENRMEEE